MAGSATTLCSKSPAFIRSFNVLLPLRHCIHHDHYHHHIFNQPPKYATPYTAKSAWHPVVHLIGTADVVLVILALVGQINSAMTVDLSLPTSGDRFFCMARMEPFMQ